MKVPIIEVANGSRIVKYTNTKKEKYEKRGCFKINI